MWPSFISFHLAPRGRPLNRIYITCTWGRAYNTYTPPFFPPAKAGEITSAKKVAKTKSKTDVYENVK